MKIIKITALVFLILCAGVLCFTGSFFYKHFSWDAVSDVMTVSETLGKQKPEAPKYLKETGILVVSTAYGAREDIDRHILWALEYIKEDLGYKNTLAILKDVNNFDQLQSVIIRLEGEGAKKIIVVPMFTDKDSLELQVFSYTLNTKETNIEKMRLINARKIKHLRRIFLADSLPLPSHELPDTVEMGKKINRWTQESIENGLKYFGVKYK